MDMTIFVVEDNRAIFNSLKERLGQWSFNVKGADDYVQNHSIQMYLQVRSQVLRCGVLGRGRWKSLNDIDIYELHKLSSK